MCTGFGRVWWLQVNAIVYPLVDDRVAIKWESFCWVKEVVECIVDYATKDLDVLINIIRPEEVCIWPAVVSDVGVPGDLIPIPQWGVQVHTIVWGLVRRCTMTYWLPETFLEDCPPQWRQAGLAWPVEVGSRLPFIRIIPSYMYVPHRAAISANVVVIHMSNEHE